MSVNSRAAEMVESTQTSSEFIQRIAIIESLRAARTPTEIITFFGYSKSTVYRVAQKFSASMQSEEDPCDPARKRHLRERTTRTPETLKQVQDLISKDPGISLRKLASILDMSNTTMRRIAEEDLRYTSYVIEVRQMLSEDVKRVARLLLCSFKNQASRRFKFFSDEKTFTVDAKVNHRNDR